MRPHNCLRLANFEGVQGLQGKVVAPAESPLSFHCRPDAGHLHPRELPLQALSGRCVSQLAQLNLFAGMVSVMANLAQMLAALVAYAIAVFVAGAHLYMSALMPRELTRRTRTWLICVQQASF